MIFILISFQKATIVKRKLMQQKGQQIAPDLSSKMLSSKTLLPAARHRPDAARLKPSAARRRRLSGR
jgi:hypothetical protein